MRTINKLHNLLVWGMGLLMFGLPVGQVLSANLSQWRPATVAQAPKPVAAQNDPRFRPVLSSQPQPVHQVAVAVPAPQAYYPPQPVAPVYAPHYGWHAPQQVYMVPQVVQPQPVQPMVTVVAPETAMHAPDANKWRPVMPNVVAAVPQPQMVQPYIAAQPNAARQWRPAMPAVAVTPAYTYAQPAVPTWPQHNTYAVPAPVPVAPVQAPVPVPAQPWWWQGQQWHNYPYATPWPGQASDIIADFPANMCAGCKT